MNNHKILVVSTDPAHSLGDALDVNLKPNMKKNGINMSRSIVQMTDPLTMGNLYAMEVNTDAAIEKFQNVLSSFTVQSISETYGLSPDLLSSFGLDDISNLLSNPPPGLDELIALSQILNDEYVQSEFDIIVVDTAPTGHTLRMLALPEFLDGFLTKLLSLRQKLSGVMNMVQTFMGSTNKGQFENRKQSFDTALSTIEDFRLSMNTLRQTLSDDQLTNFVIVSIPTKLSVNESKRLMKELMNQGIKVSDIVMNQCVVGNDGDDSDSDAMDAMVNYYTRRKDNQIKWVNELESAVDKVSSSPEYMKNGGGKIALTKVPFFDVELVGTPALAYLGSTVYNDDKFQYLMEESDDSKFVICGGKGGVGKTTTSSSLAVSMAAAGRNVALVSTDPAHSLGDVFDYDFTSGDLVDVPLIGVPYTDGSLSVLEVDPSKSLNEFKELIDNFLANGDDNDSDSGGNDFGKTLREFGDIFDTLPAGTDEVVALAKVVGLIKNGNFDRIVLDTAPTGHTLRMLSTPGFISELIDKVLSISNKINSNSMLKMMISNAAGGGNDELDEKTKAARKALVNFQFQMFDLEDLFSNADQTEFLIVSVPTELAVRESVRLLNDLTYEAPDMPIKVRNVVANQVLKDDGSDITTFLNRVAEVQKSSIQELKNAATIMDADVEITEVPYLDTEPRGVFGLKALSLELVKEKVA